MKRQLVFAFKLLTITSAYLFTRSRTPVDKLKFPGKSLAVLFILENLKRIFLYNFHLIKDSKNQVDILENDIRLFKAFLNDCAGKPYRSVDLEKLAAEIQDLVTEAEDTIAAAMNQAAENRARNFFQRAFGGEMKRIGMAKEVRIVRAKVRTVYDKRRDVFSCSDVRWPGA